MNDSVDTQWVGRVAVVTGAAGAMGQSCVRELRRRGAEVAAFVRAASVDSLDLDGAVPIAVDIGDPASIRAAFAVVDNRWGQLDFLVNFAAVSSSRQALVDIDEQEWDRVIAVNLSGTFWCCQEAVARMKPRGRGSIVNISSVNGFMGRAQFPTHAYATSKAGVIGLTTTLASELGDYGIRVNCVAPGLHLSEASLALAVGAGGDTTAFLEEAAASAPLRRVADAEEMTGPVMFFLGDDSAYMTGQVVASDGGRSTWYH